jgi:serine/threonine protein kinase
MTAEPQAQLFAGKYRFVRMLGKGAMGEVWLAEEEGPRNFRRRVAVKRLLGTSEIGDIATESFVAEAQVIAKLDHPNIVRLVELGNSEGGLYLVLDFVDGAALDRLYRRTGAFSPAAVAYIGREVAKALEAVHTMCDDSGNNCGVVHRDVTPSNILVSRDGRVRLTDFGVARISGMGGERTETGVFKGKLPYMPPEQARGERFDGRADIFALGISLFEGILGRRLRKAETQTQLLMMISVEPVPRVHDLIPNAPRMLAQAIDLATQMDAQQRVSDAGELVAMLDEALRECGSGAEKQAQAELKARLEQVAAASKETPQTERPPAWNVQLGTASGALATNPGASLSEHGSLGQIPTPSIVSGSVVGSSAPPASNPSQVGRSVTGVGSYADAQGTGNTALNRRTSPMAIVGLVAFTILGGGLAFLLLSRAGGDKPGPAGPSSSVTASAQSAPGDVAVNVAAVGSSSNAALPSSNDGAPSSQQSSGKTTSRKNVPPPPPPPPPPPVEESNEPGTLVVSVVPWGDVTVDGRGVGTTPLAPISLPPGPHSVSVRNSELGASRSSSVTIKPGKPSSIRFDLRKTE